MPGVLARGRSPAAERTEVRARSTADVEASQPPGPANTPEPVTPIVRPSGQRLQQGRGGAAQAGHVVVSRFRAEGAVPAQGAQGGHQTVRPVIAVGIVDTGDTAAPRGWSVT